MCIYIFMHQTVQEIKNDKKFVKLQTFISQINELPHIVSRFLLIIFIYHIVCRLK